MAGGMSQFTVSATNPNDVAGGGGCACSPAKPQNSGGPYAVFNGTEQMSPLSPYTVVCVACATDFVNQAGGHAVAVGQYIEPADPQARTDEQAIRFPPSPAPTTQHMPGDPIIQYVDIVAAQERAMLPPEVPQEPAAGGRGAADKTSLSPPVDVLDLVGIHTAEPKSEPKSEPKTAQRSRRIAL